MEFNARENDPSHTSRGPRVLLTTLMLVACAAPVAAQTRPASTIEVGPGNVGDDSFKAGEYTGLNDKGVFGIGNVDVRGGNSGYNTATTQRWRIKGTDLGLDTRSLAADVGQQGRFRLSAVFDQLRRNRSDTYETPFLGAGSGVLSLPGTWIVPTIAGVSGSNLNGNVTSARGLVPSIGTATYINSSTASATYGSLLAPTSDQMALVNAAAVADLPLFHNIDLFTKRTSVNLAVSYHFDERWGFDANVRPEHKDGMKPMGTVSRNTGADISTIIPDPIDNNHTQTNAALNFKSAKGFAQIAYYGSIYRNNVSSVSWQNWATPTGIVNTMSSTPGNSFNQFNISTGISLSPTAKLVADGSYGRGTQNDRFLTDSTTPVVPVSSLNGVVDTTTFHVKYTNKPTKKLNLLASYKFDDRNNRTAIHIFQYADAGEAPVANASFAGGPSNPLGAVLAQNANSNRPYSRKLNQVSGDAEYALPKHQWIKAGYDFEKVDRFCVGAWISCADADTTNEHAARAEWRTSAGSTVSARVNYAYSVRRTPSYNENAFLALVPYANVSPLNAVNGMTALSFMAANGWTGWGPPLGYGATTGNMNMFFPSNNALANAMYANNNRISELPGMRRYFVADRNRSKVRSALSWQATDAFSFQGGVDINRDLYPDATYGLQDSKGWAANIDGTYLLGEDFSADVFYSFEDMRGLSAGNSYTANSNAATLAGAQATAIGLAGNSCDGFTTLLQRNNNNKLDPCLNWTSDMRDIVHTVGLSLRKRIGVLDLAGYATLSHSRWDNTVAGGNWANNLLLGPGSPATTIAAFFIPTSAVPTVATDSGEVRVSARFAVDKLQALRIAYSYLRMSSGDPIYEGMQFGSVSTVLPTNEQPFKYSVSAVGVSYILTF